MTFERNFNKHRFLANLLLLRGLSGDCFYWSFPLIALCRLQYLCEILDHRLCLICRQRALRRAELWTWFVLKVIFVGEWLFMPSVKSVSNPIGKRARGANEFSACSPIFELSVYLSFHTFIGTVSHNSTPNRLLCSSVLILASPLSIRFRLILPLTPKLSNVLTVDRGEKVSK